MARVRRITMLAAVYLLLGSVVSVAVAWGFAAQFPWTYWGVEIDAREKAEDLDGPVPAWAMKALGNPKVEPNRFARSGFSAVGVTGVDTEAWEYKLEQEASPFAREELRPPIFSEMMLSQRHRFGWPFRAMERVEFRLFYGMFSPPWEFLEIDQLPAGVSLAPDGEVGPISAFSGWHAFDRENAPYPYPVRFPVQPLWLGMAANSIFYGAIIAALVATPGLIRRAIRARRVRAGLCPSCRYPRGVAAVCSECGERLA